jgi:hypothetical protein
VTFSARRAAALRSEATRRASEARHGIVDNLRAAVTHASRLSLRAAFAHLRAAVECGAENARAEDMRRAADEMEGR